MEVIFSSFAAAVFVVLWCYIAAATFTDGDLLTGTWAWLSGLSAVAAIVVWLAILPVAVFVWAWQVDPSPLVMGIVLLGLVAWTAVAFSGLFRMLRGRLGGHAP
jgi:hypothetical protein